MQTGEGEQRAASAPRVECGVRVAIVDRDQQRLAGAVGDQCQGLSGGEAFEYRSAIPRSQGSLLAHQAETGAQ